MVWMYRLIALILWGSVFLVAVANYPPAARWVADFLR